MDYKHEKNTLIFIEDSHSGKKMCQKVLCYMQNNVDWYIGLIKNTNVVFNDTLNTYGITNLIKDLSNIKSSETVKNIVIMHDELVAYSNLHREDKLNKQIKRLVELGIKVISIRYLSMECALLSFKKLDKWLRLSGDNLELYNIIQERIYLDWVDYCAENLRYSTDTFEEFTFKLLNKLCRSAPGNFRYEKGEIQDCWMEDCKDIDRIITIRVDKDTTIKERVCDNCNIKHYTGMKKISEIYQDSLLNNWDRLN